MKRAILIAMLLCGVLLVAQQPPASPLDDASFSDRVYTNRFFGFSYTLPEGFTAADLPNGPLRNGPPLYRLVAAFAPPSHRGVFILTDYRKSSLDAAQSVLPTFANGIANTYEIVEPAAERTYAGRLFSTLLVHAGGGYYGLVNLIAWRGYIVGFLFTADTPAELEPLAASLETASFFGPDTLLPAPPPNPQRVTPSWSSGTKAGTGCGKDVNDASAEAPVMRVRVSEGVAQGLLCATEPLCTPVQPIYPPLARAARIQGKVLLQGTIGCDGNVRELHVISGHPLLVPAAMDAVRQWRYRPYLLNGKLVEVETRMTVNFTLAEP